MKRQSGFTLIEMMIVMAIILIIAAITIPNLIDAKIRANEASAVQSIRAINQMEVAYQGAYGDFAESLANLGGVDPCTKSPTTACLLDQSLAGGEKSGYRFAATGNNPAGGMSTGYVVGAAPLVFDRSGKRRFCTTDKNVLRADLNAAGSMVPPDAAQCAEFSAMQ